MKKNLALILALVLFASCNQDISELEQNQPTSSLQKKALEYVWVCNHPQTKFHNKVCVEDVYPMGCFVTGDPSKFCWILTASDCQEELLYDWQTNNCHLLKED
tara:strand:+ start:816 stop:1124 length:309 start_codon:yes stop_codon:yes gene_type:complete